MIQSCGQAGGHDAGCVHEAAVLQADRGHREKPGGRTVSLLPARGSRGDAAASPGVEIRRHKAPGHPRSQLPESTTSLYPVRGLLPRLCPLEMPPLPQQGEFKACPCLPQLLWLQAPQRLQPRVSQGKGRGRSGFTGGRQPRWVGGVAFRGAAGWDPP